MIGRMHMAQGRVALVTGSSRGLGRAIARRLARDGLAVAVNGLHEDGQAAEVARTIDDDGVAGIDEAAGQQVEALLRAGDAFESLARNELAEYTAASPAAAGGRIYLRTERRLFSISARRSSAVMIESDWSMPAIALSATA